MTVTVGAGTTDRSHWANRAQALLAPLLHAAAMHGREMETVVDWVMRHELDEPGILLEDQRASRLAFGSLVGLLNTEDRERSSIFSAAADALQAYTSEGALADRERPELRPGRVRRQPRHRLHLRARRRSRPRSRRSSAACWRRSAARPTSPTPPAQLPGRVLFALDEVANIAPLEELPQIASEGGGQGLTLLAALPGPLPGPRPLGQGRRRVPDPVRDQAASSPGSPTRPTLEAVSTTLGEYDRRGRLRTSDASLFSDPRASKTRTVSTQRTRVLSPGEIAKIPAGHALHLDGTALGAADRSPPRTATEPWQTLTTPAGCYDRRVRRGPASLRRSAARDVLRTILGRCQHSSAWSVCLDRWATDVAGVGGLGC